MARKKHAGAHENHERWLLTYADMITLLVAFFIMLYAMSITSKAKFEVLALSVRSGFNGNERMQSVPLSPGSGILQSNSMIAPVKDTQTIHSVGPLGIPKLGGEIQSLKQQLKAQQEQDSLNKLQKQIQDEAKRRGLESMIKVSQNERGLTVRILTDKLLFGPGNAQLQTHSNPLLDYIATALRTVPNDVAVEGHTDDLPINTPQYPSNWELSTARATNVLRYLVEERHFSPTRISAAGYAYTRPIVPNINDANRSRNRRVDIVVLRRFATVDQVNTSE